MNPEIERMVRTNHDRAMILAEEALILGRQGDATVSPGALAGSMTFVLKLKLLLSAFESASSPVWFLGGTGVSSMLPFIICLLAL